MCRVEGCTSPPETTVVTASNGRAVELGVCQEHAELLAVSARWFYSHEDGSIHLGRELSAGGIKRLRDFAVSASFDVAGATEALGPDAKVWRLDLEELDGTASGSVQFVMTPELQRNLRLMLALLQPHGDDQP
jgi:hypothetical protein